MAGGSGSGTGSSSGSSGSSGSDSGGVPEGGVVLSDAGVNMVPAGYTGTPFKANTIPGTIYGADYDTGGPGVAYCHAPGVTGAACGNGRTLHDWCCPNGNDKLCWDTVAVCPPYRTGMPCVQGSNAAGNCPDNGGLSHMNPGEPDDYPNGMTVTPYFPYLSYSVTGEWFKYTVQVLEAGTYSVSGLDGTPRPDQNAQPTVSLDFGAEPGAEPTTGVFNVPPSICGTPDPGCTEGYHVWQTNNNMATVTFPAPGTYVMTMNLVTSFFNPGFWVFAKM